MFRDFQWNIFTRATDTSRTYNLLNYMLLIIRRVTKKFIKLYKTTSNTFYISYKVLHMFDNYDTSTSTLKCKIVRIMSKWIICCCEKWDVACIFTSGHDLAYTHWRCPVRLDGDAYFCISNNRVSARESDRHSLLHRFRRNPTINNEIQEKFAIINEKFSQIFLPSSVCLCISQSLLSYTQGFQRSVEILWNHKNSGDIRKMNWNWKFYYFVI